MKRENQERVYNVMFVKQKTGGYSARVYIPPSIVHDLKLKPGDRIQYTKVEKGVKIKKYEEKA